ncbi:MAG TPA: FGGY-family carbohydrate kinase [Acidobacteriaceae bacterium]|nr:FGGY-family carbohydrate kinase [Acidobacteriaceae bacterium]
MSQQAAFLAPKDKRALIAVDLGAESCRVSLLRWRDDAPEITLVHRFANGPVESGGLHWPMRAIEDGIDDGLRRCAELAPEGIRSVAVDGWAVDYVRVGPDNTALDAAFCYRDERTIAAQQQLHTKISPQRLQEITGIQLARLNTLYQLYADDAANLPPGTRWLNLPEYMLTRWGAAPFAEYTNATHTGMIDLATRNWSAEIFAAAGLDLQRAATITQPGTRLGKLRRPLAELAALRDTELIAPACHDTASAIAGIPAHAKQWAYISSGTWSLIGALLSAPCNSPSALADDFTNLGAIGNRICFHKAVNGMWLLKQCMDAWEAAGTSFTVEDLVRRASVESEPPALLDVGDPELGLVGNMPSRINAQLRAQGHATLDESPAGAARMAALIFHSLAAAYARALEELRRYTGVQLTEIVVVGGGCRNDLLCRLTAERTGLPVRRGAPESSTIGNFAVQLAALEGASPAEPDAFAAAVSSWAATLLHSAEPASTAPAPSPICNAATS